MKLRRNDGDIVKKYDEDCTRLVSGLLRRGSSLWGLEDTHRSGVGIRNMIAESDYKNDTHDLSTEFRLFDFFLNSCLRLCSTVNRRYACFSDHIIGEDATSLSLGAHFHYFPSVPRRRIQHVIAIYDRAWADMQSSNRFRFFFFI